MAMAVEPPETLHVNGRRRTFKREVGTMNRRYRWTMAVILLAGCGEQEKTSWPSPQGAGAEVAAGGNNRRSAGDGTESPYTKAELKSAIKDLGGRWSSTNERVSFSGTELTDADLEYVKWIPSLKKLRVSHTNVTDAGLVHILGLRQLQELDLSDTQITDAGLEQLTVFPKLRYLRLAETQVSDASLEILKDLPALEALDLSDTQITDAGLQQIGEITNLQSLYLSTDQFPDADVERLKSALPGCRILRD